MDAPSNGIAKSIRELSCDIFGGVFEFGAHAPVSLADAVHLAIYILAQHTWDRICSRGGTRRCPRRKCGW